MNTRQSIAACGCKKCGLENDELYLVVDIIVDPQSTSAFLAKDLCSITFFRLHPTTACSFNVGRLH